VGDVGFFSVGTRFPGTVSLSRPRSPLKAVSAKLFRAVVVFLCGREVLAVVEGYLLSCFASVGAVLFNEKVRKIRCRLPHPTSEPSLLLRAIVAVASVAIGLSVYLATAMPRTPTEGRRSFLDLVRSAVDERIHSDRGSPNSDSRSIW